MMEAVINDLRKSGLSPEDMQIRELDSPERTASKVPPAIEGYVIPYYSIEGKRLPFYRCRLFDHVPKYKQPGNTPNHLYFPKDFKALWEAQKPINGMKYIIFTEGEKKAAACAICGIPAVSAGGVDSWRNKTLELPEGTELMPGKAKGTVIAKLPDDYSTESLDFALGFQELVQILLTTDTALIIAYDTDGGQMKFAVQRAAATLGYELRHIGVATQKIRQLMLPIPNPADRSIENQARKVGLDDYLIDSHGGPKKLITELITKVMNARSAFPRHPNVKDYVNKKLQSNRINRKDSQKVALSILMELDACGMRLHSEGANQLFYFNEQDRSLTRIQIATMDRDLVDFGPFGNMLFDKFGLGRQDRQVVGWLAQLLSTEKPIEKVTPRRIVYADRRRNEVSYQINDGQYVKFTQKGMEIYDNGSGGVLFESGLVEPIDAEYVLKAYEAQSHSGTVHGEIRAASNSLGSSTEGKSGALAITGQPAGLDNLRRVDGSDGPPAMDCWWLDTLYDTRIKGRSDPNYMRAVAILYYLSPWVNRWRGTQLPVELVVGESGSGKSTLCSLRLDVLIGRPQLRNAPSDLRDWHSSIISSGGLHVTDNVQFTDKQLRQKLSDEICRIVTEPDPHVEMRKLYTTSDLARFAVDCVFSFTAISQPFPNADLINRSFLVELDKASSSSMFDANGVEMEHAGTEEVTYGSAWALQQLLRMNTNNKAKPFKTVEEARANWIVHHGMFLTRLFTLIDHKWNEKYAASHRLINFEQLMALGAEVFGWDGKAVVSVMAAKAKALVSESDWALEGLSAWVELQKDLHHEKGKWKTMKWAAGDMVPWFEQNEEFKECQQLTNARRLGRYMLQHKYLVGETTGLISDGKRGGSIIYKIVK